MGIMQFNMQMKKFGFVNCYNLIRIFYQNIVFLSCQKFSSNDILPILY